MRSASPDLRSWARLDPGLVPWPVRVELALGGALVYCVAASTVSAHWVPGSDTLAGLAMSGFALMAVLALVRRVAEPICLAAGLAAGAVLSWLWVQPHLVGVPAFRPDGLQHFPGWWHRETMAGGFDSGFFLLLVAALMWTVGAWLAWCVLRRRQPMLGLVPGAAAFSTTLLNFPGDQNGYLLVFLLAVPGLLMWSHYHRAVEDAGRRQVRLTGDSRWDFWEAGVVATAALLVLGIFLPPLSRTDSTVDIQNGVFRGWAELQQRLNHDVPFSNAPSQGTSIGFSTDAPLSGPLSRSGTVVMTYSLGAGFAGPHYFRGLDLVRTSADEWSYAPGSGFTAPTIPLGKDQLVPYADPIVAQETGTASISMLKPPAKAPDVLFYPGMLQSVDRPALAYTSIGFQGMPGGKVLTLDRLSQLRGQAGGTYKVTVSYSTASESALAAAGTDYPVWIQPYRNFTASYSPDAAGVTGVGVYRDPKTLARIRQLALQVTAGTSNPYEAATAIESFLRSGYTYSLHPPPPTAAFDPIAAFLFRDKQGYCEYFATAMGDMLRSIGIPVRLVNGYGPGSFDNSINRYVVKESDAHTWVEVYFPGYGFVPFEPTPDGTYFPIPRGSIGPGCTTDSGCAVPGGSSTAPVPAPLPSQRGLDPGSNDRSAAGGLPGRLGSLPLLPAFGLLVLLVAVAFLALSRFLRPSTAGGAWRRARLLARLAGVAPEPADTPLEFAERLAGAVPEGRGPALRLAERYAIAAYAPAAAAAASREAVLEAYVELRPVLIGRIRARRGRG